MKFKYVGKTKVVEGEEVEVSGYNGTKVKHGSVIELTGHLADKADKNPDYEQVDGPKEEAGVGLGDLHWTQLKKKVEAAGGTWEGKEQAIEYLNGLQ